MVTPTGFCIVIDQSEEEEEVTHDVGLEDGSEGKSPQVTRIKGSAGDDASVHRNEGGR